MSKLEIVVIKPTSWASKYDRVPLVCPDGIPAGTTLGLVCVTGITCEGEPDVTEAHYITDEETMVEMAADSSKQRLWFIVPRKLIRPVCPDFE